MKMTYNTQTQELNETANRNKHAFTLSLSWGGLAPLTYMGKSPTLTLLTSYANRQPNKCPLFLRFTLLRM